MNPTIATGYPIDLPVLLETRALVQANSGGGKSWLLRRMLEQTAPLVQQLVIDPEGEFATLRERFDYIIAAPHDADAIATPQTAALLARRLLESGVSAVLDIYDLKAHDRQLFVKRFLESLINAPRALWHPVMVVIDEVHVFCPQTGSADASAAVIDLATRGRKRGQCMIGATQRLSKLHKDVAAELQNKFVGRTSLDIDMKRAADELGLASKEAVMQLRTLDPGEFFVYGPALTRAPERVTVGQVATSHPKAGQRLMQAPPPASKKVLASLAKLADLQKEAEHEARTIDELRASNADLARRLTMAEKRAQQAGVPEKEVQRRIAEAVRAAPAAPAAASLDWQKAQRLIQQLSARSPAGYSKPQVGALTKFSHKGGTFNTYLSDLRRAGYIDERDGLLFASETGIHSLGDKLPPKPTTHDEVMALWRTALRAGAFAMLETIVGAGAAGIDRRSIAEAVGMSAAGGTFNTYLSDLRRNGLITEARGGACVANDILFPEATR